MIKPQLYNFKNSLDDKPFFCRQKEFYKSFFNMLLLIALQNIITYSVNIADNIMLGAYSQSALAGAAAVNQIQYILQQLVLAGLGEGLIILSGQYWGKKNTKAVQQIIGTALLFGVMAGVLLTAAAFAMPEKLVAVFTDNEAVKAQAVEYLSLIRFTYLPFIITNILLVALRSAQVVKIAFKVSCAALVLNIGINYTLIFGSLGAPELGIKGAAIGTLAARCMELCIVLLYCKKQSLPLSFKVKELFAVNKGLAKDYLRVSMPCVFSALLFSCAVAIQTIIYGHVSQDAMAAASASGALFQYCKMIPVSAASAAGVLIARAVGGEQIKYLRSYVRTLQLIFAAIGAFVFALILLVRVPVLSMYAITPAAHNYAMQMLLVQAVAGAGMSYQMPCQIGIIRAGGDTLYTLISDLIYSWIIVVPLGLLAAFVWKLPFAAVAVFLNCDQVIKCFTVAFKTNRYTWIKKLAK